jgi:alpha-glucoside transport system permease protein
MVLFSAAIKAVPAEMLEAARIDGAGAVRIFFQIVVPTIMGMIVTVSATVIISTLKIFDVVIVMTGGNFGTDVIATQFYDQYFVNRNFGLGSTIAIVLLVLVIPVGLPDHFHHSLHPSDASLDGIGEVEPTGEAN